MNKKETQDWLREATKNRLKNEKSGTASSKKKTETIKKGVGASKGSSYSSLQNQKKTAGTGTVKEESWKDSFRQEVQSSVKKKASEKKKNNADFQKKASDLFSGYKKSKENQYTRIQDRQEESGYRKTLSALAEQRHRDTERQRMIDHAVDNYRKYVNRQQAKKSYKEDPDAEKYIKKSYEGYNAADPRPQYNEKSSFGDTGALIPVFGNKEEKERRRYGVGDTEYLNEEERKQYSYLLGKYGAETANTYLDGALQKANERESMDVWKDAYKYAYEHPVKGTLANTAHSIQSGLAGLASNANALFTGENEDPNSPMFKGTIYREAAQQAVSDRASIASGAEEGSFKDNAVRTLVGAGMSGLDTLARLPFGGIAGAALAGGDAAAGAYADAYERGASGTQARLQSLAQGAAEMVFERFSIEGLRSFTKEPVRGVKQFVKNLGKQMVTEGSEEAATELANTVTDKMIMQEASNFDAYRNAFIEAGEPEDGATKKAFIEIGKNVLLAAAGGAISGGVLGGATMGVNTKIKSMVGKASGLGEDVSYQDLADTIDIEPESYMDAEGTVNEETVLQAEKTKAYAEALAKREASGQKVNNLEKADLQQEIYNLARKAVEANGKDAYGYSQAAEETAGVQTEQLNQEQDISEQNPTLMRMAREMVGLNTGFQEDVQSGSQKIEAIPIMLGTPEAAQSEEAARMQWQNIIRRPDFEGMRLENIAGVTLIEKTGDGNLRMTEVSEGGQQTDRIFSMEEVGKGKGNDILFKMPYATNLIGLDAEVFYRNFAVQNTPEEQLRAQLSEQQKAEAKGRRMHRTQSLQYAGTDIQGAVAEFGSVLPEDATQKMVDLYDGSVNMDSYMRAFRRMYSAGRNNVEISMGMQSELASALTTEQMVEAYKKGAQDRFTAIEEEKKKAAKETGKKRKGGLGKAVAEATEAQKRAVQVIGEKTGLKINISDRIAENAIYNRAHGEVTISVYSKNFNQSVAHELTHFLQDYAPEEYRAYKDAAIAALMEAKDFGYDQAFDLYEEAYERVGVRDSEKITDEMVSDAAGMFLNDEDFINRIARENRSLAQKIRDFLSDILDAIRELISTKNLSGVAKSLYRNKKRYQDALALWTDALEKASGRYKNGAGYRSEEGRRYKLNEFGLEEFTEKEKEGWSNNNKIVYINTKEELVDFAQWMLDKDLKVQRWGYLGKIGKQIAEKIKKDTGIDLEGLKIVIDKQGMEHANSHHAKEEKKEIQRGQVPVTAEMYADIPEIFASYDFAELGDKENYIKLTKDIGGLRVILAIVTPSRYMVRVEDMWQMKKSLQHPAISSSSKEDASSNVRNALGNGSLNGSISQDEPEIKYQLDLGEPVEQTKKLIAVHNLTEGKMLKVLDLGGFVMPSIAIIKESLGHSKFGNISVIFRKDSIRPTDKRNKIYSADAYTTRMPMEEYEYDQKKIKKLADKLGKSESYVESNYLEGSMDRVVKKLEDAIEMQEYYAKTIGEELPEDYYDRMDRAREIAGFDNKSGKYGKAYREFVRNELEQIVKGKGFYKSDVDPFYPDGRSKSWKQMHVAFEPEAALKLMLKQKGRNQEGGFGITINQLRAAVSKQYKSIDELHENEGRLQISEDTESWLKELNDRLDDLVRNISDDYSDMDSVAEAMIDVAKKPQALNWELAKYSIEATEEQLQEFRDIIGELREVPVQYFEAKPERVVGFDEVAAVILPDNVSEELREKIKSKGMEIREYAAEDEESRKRAISKVDGIRFQLEIDDHADMYDQMQRENKNLQSAVEYLTSQLSSKENFMPSKTDVRNAAKALIDATGSYIELNRATERLTSFYNWIHNSDYIDGEEVSAVAADIAADFLTRSNSDYDIQQMKLYGDFRSVLKHYALRVPEAYRGEFSQYGGYNAFRKRYFGTLNFRKDGTEVDKVYGELHDKFPEYFPEDIINPADQLIRIADTLDALRPHPTINKELDGADFNQASFLIGQQIIDSYFDVRYTPGKDNNAQKRNASLKKFRDDIRREMNEKVREVSAKNQKKIDEIRERYDKADRETKAYYQNRIKELRDYKNMRIDAQKDLYLERMAKQRDFYKGHKYKDMIRKDAAEMTRWLLHPTDQKHVPEMLRKPLAEFLREIDFRGNQYNQKGEITKRWELFMELQNVYRSIIDKGGILDGPEGSMYVEIDNDILPKMAELSDKIKNGIRLDEMTEYQLRELKDIVRAMKKSIVDSNKLIQNKRFETIQAAGEASIRELDALKEKKDHAARFVKIADNVLNNGMLDSFTRFKSFGKAAYSIYQELREGLDKKIRLVREAELYFDKLLKDNNTTDKDLKRWGGKKAETISIKTVRGEQIEMTVSQAMSLYQLMKREQAKKHILDGGIKIAEATVKTNKGAVVLKSKKPVRITELDAVKIVEQLTDQQKAIADGISRFFVNNTSRWGNETSMKLYGYEKFHAPNYFPIRSDRNQIATKEDDIAGGTVNLRNIGMTKATVKNANNPIMVEDIMDVFTRQVDQMSSYSAFVVPLSDMQKWMNYKKNDGDVRESVKDSIEAAFGGPALEYIRKLMEDINGVGTNDQYFGKGLISMFKASAVGANLRVVIQQPTSYVRAAAEINPKYLIAAAPKMVGGFLPGSREKWELIKEYAPIAQWKDWGFFETSVGKSMEQILIGTETRAEWLREKQMSLAAKGDEITWIAIWNAVELEVADKNKNLEKGTKEFYKKVGERFGEVIDATQVVDSVLHRSEIMRSKQELTKMATSFMSEPTKSYNMIYRAAFDVMQDWKSKEAWQKLIPALVVFTASAAATAAASAVVSAMRDKDKEKEFGEKYVDAFVSDFTNNVNPVGMVPLAKDVLSIMQGYDVSRTDMEIIQETVWAAQKIYKFAAQRMKGEETEETIPSMLIYGMRPLSSLTGIAADNMLRDLEAIVDTVINAGNLNEAEYVKSKITGKNIAAPKNTKAYVEMALQAYVEGDDDLGDQIIEDLKDAGIEEEKIESAYAEFLKNDDRVLSAAQAKVHGNSGAYNARVAELVEDGYSAKMVESRVKSVIDDLNPYSYADLNSTIDAATGSSREDLKKANEMLEEFARYQIAKNGWDESEVRKNIRTQMTKYFKPLYVSGNADTRSLILRKLRMVKYKGINLYDSDKDILAWGK